MEDTITIKGEIYYQSLRSPKHYFSKSGKGLSLCAKTCHFIQTNTKHREIYEAISRTRISSNMDIHHINGNHYDNSFDNLLLCTHIEHQRIHANDPEWCQRCGNLESEHKEENDYKKYLQEYKTLVINDSKYLNEYINKKLNKIKNKKEQEKELKRQNKIKQREDDIQNKIDSGNYIVSKTGRLFNKDKYERRKQRMKEWWKWHKENVNKNLIEFI